MRRSILAALSAGTCVLAVGVPADAVSSKAPAPAHHLRAKSIATTSLVLAWSNPTGQKFHRTVVRMRSGSSAPASPHAGKRVASLGRSKHSLKVKHLSAGRSYAFSVFTGDGHGHFARAATLRTGTRTSAPSGPRAYEDPSSTVLRWTNPHGAHRLVVRYAKGVAAPTSTSRGTGVHLSSARSSAARLSHLSADTRYAASIFSIDRFGHASAPAVVRFTTPAHGAAPTGTYNGHIVDVQGNPLMGASVFAYSEDDSAEPVKTDSNGAFHFSLSSGSWYLDVDGSRATGGLSDTTGYQPTETGPVEINAGHTVTGTSITLSAGGVLTGRITDTTGAPLADASVYLAPVTPYVSSDFGDGLYADIVQTEVPQTAPDGTFSVHGVPDDGAVRVCAYADAATSTANPTAAEYLARCSRHSVLVHAGQAAATTDLALHRGAGGTLSGHVKGSNGKAVTTGYVLVSGTDDFFDFQPILDDGSYELTGLDAGSYEVCAYTSGASGNSRTGYAPGCAKAAAVTVSHTTTVNLTLQTGAAVSGRVLASGGAPVANVPVVISSSDDYTTARTDSRGHYRAVGLSPGKVRACFYGPYGTSPKVPTGVLSSCYAKRAAFEITRDQVRTGVDGVLPIGGAVSGRITDTDGVPVAGAYVYAESASDDEDSDGGSAQTGADGRFVLRGLATGAYYVCAEPATATDEGEDTCRSKSTHVTVRRTTTGANLVLPASTGITVSVVDQNGTPVAGVDAVAVSPCGEDCPADPVLDPDYGVLADASNVTDKSGHAVLDGLSPGRYAVCLHAYYGTTASGGSPTGYADTCTAKDAVANTRFAVFVVRGTTSAVSLVLPTGGAVSGRVTDETDSPVAGVTMHIDGSAADNARDGFSSGFFGEDDVDTPLDESVTDDDGTYSVIGVRPGVSRVCADSSTADGSESPGGYLDACWSGPDGNTVNVTAGATTTGVDVALGGAAAITGKVTTPLKHGLPHVDVYVFAQGASKVVGYASTGSDGTYVVGHLAPGTYQVCFDGYEVDYGRQCYSNIAWTTGAPPLTKATAVPVADKSRVSGINGVLKVA